MSHSISAFDLSPGTPDGDAAWELFHENSKRGRLDPFPTVQEIQEWTTGVSVVLSFEDLPAVALPPPTRLAAAFGDLLVNRASPARLRRVAMSSESLGTMLHAGYGELTTTHGGGRPRRTVASAGALYPCEMFVVTSGVSNVPNGLHHYQPNAHELRSLRTDLSCADLAHCLVQSDLAENASAVILLAGVFQRSVVKYGERGYRFALLEVGAISQNVTLAGVALGLSCLHVGGFYDRDIDRLVALDGLAQSIVHLMFVGGAVD